MSAFNLYIKGYSNYFNRIILVEDFILRGVSLGNSLVLYLLVREYNLYVATI